MVSPDGASFVLEGRHALGGFAALFGRPHARQAIALSSLELLAVPGEAFLEILEDSFDVARDAIVHTARSVATLRETLGPGAPRLAPPRWVGPPEGPLGVVERLALLLDAPFLRGGGVQPLSDLATVSEERVYAEGALLFDEGESKERLELVIEGEVLAEAPGVGRQVFRAGEIACAIEVLGEVATAWSARAAARTRTVSFRIEDWFDCMEEHFGMVQAILADIGELRDRVLEAAALRAGGVFVR